MATVNLGRVGFVNKGAHNIVTTYKVNDVVTYNSGIYACIQEHTGQLPTETAYWQNWVANDKALDSAVVHKTGDETIAGVKTFSSSPISSATQSTAANALTRKDYVDGLVSSVVHKTGDETIAGVKTFSSSPIVPVPTSVNQVISMGNIIEKTGAALGYGTGSGGTVTQLTSKNTAVTLNKPCGRIITASDALVVGGAVIFIMNNSTYGSEDNVIVSTHSTSYSIEAKTGNAGVIYFILKNISGSSLSDAVSIKFTIIKGAIA